MEARDASGLNGSGRVGVARPVQNTIRHPAPCSADDTWPKKPRGAAAVGGKRVGIHRLRVAIKVLLRAFRVAGVRRNAECGANVPIVGARRWLGGGVC